MRSGYISLVGRPNVGKSTLMNALIGEKISIVSARPQTTRNRVSGIFNDDRGQIVFVDTPGIHKGVGTLNKYMVDVALASLRDVDAVAVLVDATQHPGEQDRRVIAKVFDAERPVVLVLNKIDRVPAPKLLPLIDEYRQLGEFAAIVPVSALKSQGIDDLTELFFTLIPEHPAYFPTDQITEVQERFIAAEMIREKVFEMMREELPYSTAVEIEKFDEADPKILRLAAVINVERDSQKGMMIGKGGKNLKEIGTRARKDLEQFFATKVFLEIFVRVVPDWSKSAHGLKRFGYE